MGSAETKRCAGVAFFGMSSIAADLKALEWAYKYLRVSTNYKLRIIHVNELQDGNQPRERPGSRYDEYEDVSSKFVENYPEFLSKKEKLESQWLRDKVHQYLCGVAYEGENFEAALQCAIKEEKEKDSLDTLVLAWWEADDGSKGPPITINRLQSAGCSIVFANVDSRNLTLPMPSTQTMSAAMASTEDPASTGAPPSSNVDAPTDRSNNGTRSTYSSANTPYPDGRAPAASTPVSGSITPASAQPMAPPTERPENTSATGTRRSSKPPASGSETDVSTRRPAGRDNKVTGSAATSRSRKNKPK